MPETTPPANAPAATPEAADDTKRSRGRPSLAEIAEREKALKEREADIALREREAELRIAEANANLREADLIRAETNLAAPPPVAAARTGSPRTQDARSATVTEPLRRRRYHGSEMPNEFHIADEDIPEGASYQWNNHTVLGMTNPSADSYMQMQGWVPVPAARHPHLVANGADPKGPIIVKGQILVERPMELTREALQEDYQRAIGEVERKEEQLYGARPNTPAGRELGIKKNLERPTGPVPTNYQYEADGQVIE